MSALRRILILGSRGQVGTELRRSFADAGELICPDRKDLNLVDPDRLRATIRSINPDLILNAAAYTAVDRAESEADLAMAINAHIPRVLAEEAAQRNILLVHYSTDYVFDGTKKGPWVETDVPNPLNVYGASKLAGENAIREIGGKYLIFRTSWVYGPHGNNFCQTMLRLGRERERLEIVDDQVGAPTTSIELANATRDIVDRVAAGTEGTPAQWAGIYHMTCGGAGSWYGFARAIFAATPGLRDGRQPTLIPIASQAYPSQAKRPLNSVLSNLKLDECFGIKLRPWELALHAVIEQFDVRLRTLSTDIHHS